MFCILDIEAVISGMKKALNICASSIIPSLFLFMVLSEITVSILLKNNSAFQPKAVIFFLGALCGFPIDATICEKLLTSGIIDKKSAESLLPFCNIPSPAFVIGAIGISLLNNKTLGVIIYFSVLAVSLILMFVMKSTVIKR